MKLPKVHIDTTLTNPKSLLLAKLIKDNGHWDGCDNILEVDKSYCVGCKYESYCEGLRNA